MTRKLAAHIKGNAVAYLALFVALGGTSYAAIRLPANSVGTKQLRASSVTSAKVRNGSLRPQDFASGGVRRGPRGPEGPKGDPGPFGGALPSGKTLRGRWAVSGLNADAGAGDVASAAISFGFQLAAPPARRFVLGASDPPQCPGTAAAPEAAPGTLCFYVEFQININNQLETIIGTTPGATSREGAEVYATNANAAVGGYGARGSWAVTAP
ncbi:MAG: hypothetical protein ACRDLN_02025 [Solirubrobacteraceae bacterium]